MDNILTRFLRKIKLLAVALLFVYSYQINAQCGTPVVGCPSTDFGNFGFNSNTDAGTIEYDNFTSTFHTTVVRDSDGNFQVWGEEIGHGATTTTATNVLDPLIINTTNFPGFTGTPLKASLGGNFVNNVQGVLLTTTGLHVWGRPGVVVATSLTTNWRMQPITVSGQTNGLPAGVTPAMVKMMFVTGRTIAITTCGGDAYVLSQIASINQGGSATAWTRVQDDSNNNLTGVVALRGAAGAMFALKSDNTLWTWGINTYLGDGSALQAARNRAIQMAAPVTGIDVKMIGTTFSGTAPNGYPTYYVLAKNGNLYSMGRNNERQVGDWANTNTHRTSWVQPRYTSASGQVMNNIKWISPNEHDWRYGAINVITDDAALFNWGFNASSYRMLGRGNNNTVDPGNPYNDGSTLLTSDILAVETGGHTTMLTMKCTENFGYVGHRVRGSMGNGSGTDANEQNFTFATAAVQICGAETVPAVFTVTVDANSDGTICVDGEVRLVPDISGGTFTILSGSGVLTPTGDDAILTFTNSGIVVVEYAVSGDCGPVTVEVTIEAVNCTEADLEVTKTANPSSASVGDTVVFNIEVENLGPYRAKEVQVTDLLPAGYTYVSHTTSVGSYDAVTGLWDDFYLTDGSTATLTVTATVNANGPYLNTATATSGTPDPNPDNNEDTATITIPTADLSIEKSVSNDTPNVGDTVTFILEVTNNGTINAENVEISDVVPSGYTIETINNGGVDTAGTIVWSIGNLANGASTTVSFTATVNATGDYQNTATVSSDTPDPDLTNNEDTVTTTPVTPNTTHAVNDINNTYANIPVSGSVATNDFDTEGHTQTYTPIDDTDANGNHLVLNSDGTYTFTPGTDFTGTLVYTYTVCDDGTPQACDTATLTIEVLPLPTPADNTVTANNDTATTEEGQAVNINVIANDFDMEGDTFTVTSNTQPANGTVVNNGDGTFAYTPNPGFTGVDTFTYTICDNGTPQACDTATVAVTVLPDNGTNDTYANDDAFNGDQGTPVTGNVLTNDVDPEGDDQMVSSNTQPTNGTVVMDPDGTFTYTPNDPDFAGTDQFTYTVCDNGTPQACDTATVYITVNPVTPELTLLKSGAYVDTNGDGIVNEGDHILYTFTVENTGNVTVTGITIDDATLGLTGYAVTPSDLASGETATATYNYAIAQADIDNGGVYNIATATGTTPAGGTVTDESEDPNPLDPSDPDYDPSCPTCTYTDLSAPELTLLKSGAYVDTNGDGIVNEGDHILYTFTVENTGNVTVTGITIDDATLGLTGYAVTPSDLASGETATATYNYAIAQADIDNGGVYNIATATGTTPAGGTVTDESEDPNPLDPSDPDYDPSCPTCTYTDLSAPELTLLKSGAYVDTNGDGIVNEGDHILYTFTVENTGNVTVTGITIDDATLGLTGYAVTPSDLASGETATATYNYAIAQADIDNGGVYNIATATGTTPAGGTVTDESEDPNPLDPSDPDYDPSCPTCTYTDLSAPELTLLKSGAYVDTNGDGIVNEGDHILYTFTVENTGNVTVTGITIDDATLGLTGYAVTPSDLASGETATATYNYAIAQADIDNGGVYNIATATGTTPAGGTVTDESEDPNPLDPSDPDYDPSCPTCTYTDLSAPELTLLKSGAYVDTNGDGIVNEGDHILYTFTVENTGNVTVTGITIDDATLGLTGYAVTPSDLASGETATATYNYAIAQADIDNGGVYNIATATGTTPAGGTVTDESEDPNPLDPSDPDYDPSCPTCTYTDLPAHELTLLKSGAYVDTNGDGIVNEGDHILYTFTVENTGNVTVSNLNIDDAVIGVTDLVVNPGTLAPGESGTATAMYAITQEDINVGQVLNIAFVEGTDPNGDVVFDESDDPTPFDPNDSTTIVVLEQEPNIALTKEGYFNDENADGYAQIGETITYTFVVTNTGNTTLNNVTVSEQAFSGVGVTPQISFESSSQSSPQGTLLIGESAVYTATYTIVAGDLASGVITNQAIATAVSPNDETVSDLSDDPNDLANIDADGDGDPDDITIVELPDGCIIVINNAISPNNDGVNDIFRIQGIDCYPDNTVEIYNRWGVEVFKTSGYNNADRVFNGYSNGRVTINEDEGLPPGTYWYVLTYRDLSGQSKQKIGYLYIQNN